MPWDHTALLALAARQAGVVSMSQARELGVSRARQRTRVERREWTLRLGCLEVCGPARNSDLADAAALGLRLGPTTVVSGPTAMRLGGWSVPDTALIAVGTKHHRGIEGVVLLRDGRPRRTVTGPGCRIARREEALVDTAVVLPLPRALEIVELALQRGWITTARWETLVRDRLGRGRDGAAKLRSLTDHVKGGTRSAAERRMLTLLRQARITGWISNYPVLGDDGYIVAVLDFAWPELKVCIEVDGRAFHSGRAEFEHDRARQNALLLAGWMVLRFTWQQITEHPAWVVEQIRAAIALRSAA